MLRFNQNSKAVTILLILQYGFSSEMR